MAASQDDESGNDDLFRRAMADVRPLRTKSRQRPDTSRKPGPRPRQRWQEDTEEPQKVTASPPEPVTADALLEFRRGGVSDRLFRRLRGGRIPVEAELDLHGLTAPNARRSVNRFLTRSQQRHRRCVRIIHGRGRSSGVQGPVLKTEVNHLLKHTSAVLAFTSARPWDGGSGAVYVLLKRR